MKLTTIITDFEDAIKDKEGYEILIGLFRKQSSCSIPADEETLSDFFKIMYQLLNYQEERELYPGYTSGAHIRACAYGEIERTLLLNSSSFLNLNWSLSSAHQYLAPFFQYLSNCENSYYLDWKIFTEGFPAVQEVFEEWLMEMENKEKRFKGYVDGLKKAIELNNLEEKIKQREVSWENIKESLMTSLDDNHFMVRAGAAKCIGLFYPHEVESYPKGISSFLEMLELVGNKEVEKSGVLGPFIDGYDEDCVGIYALQQNEEVKKVHFNIKIWILDILGKSKEEPGAPNAQPLDFYAHEYFESDPQSLKMLIQVGREELACYAATNLTEKIEGMEEVLKLLAKSQSKSIATSANYWLKNYYL